MAKALKLKPHTISKYRDSNKKYRKYYIYTIPHHNATNLILYQNYTSYILYQYPLLNNNIVELNILTIIKSETLYLKNTI